MLVMAIGFLLLLGSAVLASVLDSFLGALSGIRLGVSIFALDKPTVFFKKYLSYFYRVQISG